MRYLSTIALLAASLAAFAVPSFPDRFTAEYILESGGITVGRTRRTLTPDGNGRYVYETQSSVTGVLSLFRKDRIVERSDWQYQAGHMRPLAYRYTRTGGKKDRDQAIAFDWENGIAHGTVKGESRRMFLPQGTLEKHISVLALMQDLDAGRRDIQYRIAEGGKLKTYHLKAIGEEHLDTALGLMETIKVRRIRDDSKRETTLWCAPELNFLPVKMVHREKDGQVVSAVIESAQGFEAVGSPDAEER